MIMSSSNCSGEDGTGVKIYLDNKRLYARVTTQSSRWLVYTPHVGAGEWITYSVSWSQQLGLTIYVNGDRDRSMERPEDITLVQASDCPLVIGQMTSLYPGFWLDLIQVVYLHQESINDLGITTGFPQVTDVTLTVDVEEDDNDAVSFQCDFEALADPSVQYTVKYMVDDDQELSKYTGLKAGDEVKKLTQIELEQLQDVGYGSEVYCQVEACYSTNCAASGGEAVKSKVIKIELELLNTQPLVVYEGGMPGLINVKATTPPSLFCPSNKRDGCEVRIYAGVRAAEEFKCPDHRIIPQAVMAWSGPSDEAFCGVMVDAGRWSDTHAIKVQGVVDALKDGDQDRVVEVWAQVTSDLITSYIKHSLGQVALTVKDRDKGAKCVSVNDPHLETFDGTIYDNFKEGEFVFYRNKAFDYQVNTFYRSCRGTASCNCAVAVRVDDDVVVINKCPADRSVDQDGQPVEITLHRNNDLTPGFRVNQFNEDKYAVFLPNGDVVYAQVEVRKSVSSFINVWVVASGSAFNNTEGLCGSFDENRDNDLTLKNGQVVNKQDGFADQFSLEWQVSEEDSLFDGFCEVKDASGAVFCECAYGSLSVCGEARDVFQCGKTDTEQRVEVEDACNRSHGRSRKSCRSSKRSKSSSKDRGSKRGGRSGGSKLSSKEIEEANQQVAEPDKGGDITDILISLSSPAPLKCRSTEPRVLFQYNATYVHKPLDTGITLTLAQDFCRSRINVSTSFSEWSHILQGQMDVYIDFCAKDYMMTGDASWVEVAIENIKQQCLVILEYNIDFWIPDDTGVPYLPPVVNNICPNDCSGQGVCVETVCICFAGYLGRDCSLDSTTPPTLTKLKYGPVCDVVTRNDSCRALTVYGNNFINSANLTCHMTRLTQKADGTFEETQDVFEANGTFITSQEVRCTLPDLDSYNIRISNDKQTPSNDLMRVLYNSRCQTCDADKCTDRVSY